jgi:hypothetical protein
MNEPQIMAASLLAGGLVTLAVAYIPAWLYKKTGRGFSLLDIIREEGWPSLARFQFMAWTLIVIFCFTTICVMRFLGGELNLPEAIPENLLALMGISAGVTAVATGVSKSKYGEETKKLTEEEYKEFIREKKLGTMLLENDAPSLTRFQMFSWTILSIFLYLSKFFATISIFTISDPNVTVLPDIEFTLLVLMGVSQGAYVGGKWVSPSKPKIFNAAYYESEQKIIVNGINFGENKRIVKLNGTPIPEDKIKWSNEVITFTIEPTKVKKLEENEIKLQIGAKEVDHPLKLPA